MKLAPSRLAPVFVPRIWGARSLEPLFDAPCPEPVGEVWLTGDQCKFATGPFAGRALGEVWPSLGPDWTGTRIRNVDRIPLLVKFLFPEDKLSVQVHPSDDYARAHEDAGGRVGKTEMWYVIAARRGSQIGLGFEAGVTRESFERAIADGTVEQNLRQIEVHPGDIYFVPAGTVHMIGPGMVLCEIQQHSDITYRVFDFNRLQSDGTRRPLHIRQSLEVLDFGPRRGGQMEPARARPPGRSSGGTGSPEKTYLVACPYFATEKWEFSSAISAATAADAFEVLIILSGSGAIRSAGENHPYSPAEVWLLPAALGSYELVPQTATTLLRTYVPDLEAFDRQLDAENIPPADRTRLVHP